MGTEIGIHELAGAAQHVMNAGQQLAPRNPAMQILGEIRGLVQEVKGAVFAGIELLNAKKQLQDNKQGVTVVETQSTQRIEPARPPIIKAQVLVELLFLVVHNKFAQQPELREKKVGELFDEFQKYPNLLAEKIRDFYNAQYDKILDL